MNDGKPKRDGTVDGTAPPGRRGDAARAERLSAALRDNLRRRKAQQRAREAGRDDPPGDPGGRDGQ